jgi:4-diphosphocytidyl-2-C-methyl-D-erythritol kinase
MKLVELVAPAKLTLSLSILGVREDGYHLIDAEMISIDLCDLIKVRSGDYLKVISGVSGLDVPGNDDNLISRALTAVQKTAGIELEKHIPAGAGLGGGSSDAAAILRWSSNQNTETALALGADVVFCLAGGRSRVRGVGEIVDPLPHKNQDLTLLIPPIGVSTPIVYKAWDQLGGPKGLNGNDLEPAALHAYPELAEWRDALSHSTGQQARLAGSGGTWFVEGHYSDVTFQGVSAIAAKSVERGFSN